MRHRSLRRGAVALGAVLVLAGCGSQAAAPPQASAPAPSTTTTTMTGGSPAPCPSLASTVRTREPGVVLLAAALLSATVVVDAGAGGETCSVLRSGQTVHLTAGERVEFVANRAPTLTGVPPGAGTDAVRVATAPGPTSSGPGGGGLQTRHVIVTLTAVRPGTVKLSWFDCSGTAC